MNVKGNELFGQAQALYEQAKTILSSNPGAEEVQKATELMGQADELKARGAQQVDLLASAEKQLAEMNIEYERPGQERPSQERQFKSYGDFLQTVWQAMNPRLQAMGHKADERLRWFAEENEPGHDKKTLTENVGSAGGFLVPTEFRADLLAVAAEASVIRPRATVIRMTRRQVEIPVVDQTTTTAGIPHFFGGMHFHWQEEATEKDESDPKFRKVSLTAHKLIGYTNASDELVDDAAVSLADFLGGPLGFAGGAAWMEDYAFLNGTGLGMPLGIIGAPATITVAAVASPAVSYQDLCAMREHFLTAGNRTGIWIMSISQMQNMLQMVFPGANPSLVWQPNARDGVPDTVLGYPIYWTEKVPVAGVAGSVILADPQYYLIGDRQATTIESTQFDKWRYDLTSWRMVHRVDGQPWLSAPLTLQDGTSQVSPFVILGAKTT